MTYIETHAHLNDRAFEGELETVIESSKKAGCGIIINCGDCLEASVASIRLAEKYDFVYAAVGVHPEKAAEMSEHVYNELKKLAGHPKAVAIGESGLDYHYCENEAEKLIQQENFRRNIRLARETGLPLVVHDREAHEDCLRIMSEEGVPFGKAVFHCFSGSPEMAKIIEGQGWKMSFGGAVTFKNARRAPEVLKSIKRESLMLETDCPYMAPEPLRGTRNTPANIPYIIEKIAELLDCGAGAVAEFTLKNSLEFFDKIVYNKQ